MRVTLLFGGGFVAALSCLIACGPSPTRPTGTSAVTPVPPNAMVQISEFKVTRSAEARGFSYAPTLQVAETGGVSPAWITSVSFTFLDPGSPGGVPPSSTHIFLPAGTTLDLFGSVDLYGFHDLEISTTAVVTRVSVTVLFTDADGHGGSITAVTSVES